MVDEVKRPMETGLSLDVTLPSGESKNYSIGEANVLGFDFGNVNNNTQHYHYLDSSGKDAYTTDVADLPASIELNEETGNIVIKAPKAVYESPLFKQSFDEEELKKYSLAYKLNPNYKLQVREKNEETGEEEDKEITIPEYVNRLNSSVSNYMSNLKSLHNYKDNLRRKYGAKVDNLSDEALVIAQQSNGDAIYLPDSVLGVSSFGNKKNPFAALRSKMNEAGAVSVDDFIEAYTRSNFGRDEMAALFAVIDGTLRGSDWGTEDFYTDEEGVVYKNTNSATEMAKLLAFRDYILTHNPKGEDYQQMGDWVESFVDNAAYETTKIFGNLAGIAQYVVTGGQDDRILEGVREMDEAMGYFNENNVLVWDAITNAQIWGTIGGLALGTWGTGELLALPLKGAGAVGSAYTARYLNAAANMARLADAGEKISLGARMVFKAMTLAEKVNLGINTAITAIGKFKEAHFFVDYVIDTMHDAILYDAVGFKDMMTEMSKQADVNDKAAVALNYWAQQFADNAKFWGPMGVAKAAIKTAGKTALGKATDIVLTKYINKWSSAMGGWLQGKQDDIANGTVIAKLQKQLEEAEAAGKVSKANRLKRKITIELQTDQLRKARASLGNVKLEWDGVKLSEKSAEEWKNAMARVKDVENGVDLYIRGVDAEARAMLTPFKDPVTGKRRFLYEELAGANVKASNWYYGLVSLGTKYKLSPATNSLLNQDIIDYWQGSFKRNIYTSFALAGGEKAEAAEAAIPQITENLSALRQRLPREIVRYVDEGIETKVYQDFYKQLNKYGTENKLLVKEIVESYETNPIWVQNGYMPIAVMRDTNGRWIREDDKIESIVEQEMDKLIFGSTPGEHFHDPELVRQVRIRHMAQAKVNAQIWKSYSGFGSDATNITIVSGEETEFARRVGEGQKNFENVVAAQAKNIFDNSLLVGLKKRTKASTPRISKKEASDHVEEVVSSMSPSEISEYLVKKKILNAPTNKLTDGVTAENYDQWYDAQNDSVKKFLASNKQSSPMEQGKAILGTNAEPGDKLEAAIQRLKGKSEGAGGKGNVSTERIPRVDYGEFSRMASEGGDNFEEGLERAYLVGDEAFLRSDRLRGAARNLEDGQDAFYGGVLATKAKGVLEKKTTLVSDGFVDDLVDTIKQQIETYVEAAVKAPGSAETLKALTGMTDGANDAGRCIVLRELLKPDNFEAAKASLNKQIDALAAGKNFGSDDLKAVKAQAEALLKDAIEVEMGWAQLSARTLSPELGDSDDLLERVEDINNRIVAAEKRLGQDYVMYLDEMGRKSYAQVDPAFASLFNYRYRMEKAEASVLARINARMSQAFRLGTTSVNLSSFGNQLFRDFGNALLVGGAWQTVKENADNLTRVFGQSIVEQIKQFEPDEYKRIESAAEAEGRTLESVAVSRELMRGAAKAPSTTERTLYKTFMKEMRGGDAETMLRRMQTKLQGFVDKFNPDDFLNGKRENYLRNRVYASALNDAMKDGYTVEQARALAEFAMNNATTNFTRQLYHFQAIADSTPYFRAAINGAKSFWRMWALDPVGITGRIMGGLVIPTMAITGASLIDEKDREVYMNIPEYQKQNSLVFVFNGQAMSIPIPQEMGQIVAPFRQFVEYLHSSNQNDFWELMMNDLLGFSPIDLQGFSTIDMDKMISDPTLLDRINRGFARVFSQTAPIPLKSAYMLATGTDPYSGKNLRDTSYLVRNEETGELEVMDYNQNAFAQWLASIFGESMSADLAEKIVSGTIGTTGSDVLGSITKLLQEGPEAAVKDFGRTVIEQATKPFDIVEYDYTDAVWKRAIRQLTTEKKAITSSAVWEKLNSELAQTKDETQRKKILAERQNLVDEFNQRVESTITRLGSVYHGTFDRKKFAAVVSLLNFSSDSSYQSGSQYSSSLVSDQFWDSRNASVHTLERMGVTGTNDMSIFGYLATDKDGKVVVKYADPVAIMDIENQWSSQNDVHLANIKALASQNDLWNRHNAVEEQIDAIYNKGTLSDSDYDAIDAIYVNWNAEVMAALAPYVEQMTPEAAINNTQVLDYLDSLIEVPGDYKKDKYGRYVTNSKLGNGSASQAYIRNYIKNIFKVNDTAYASGNNYSDRQTYVKENYRWI